MRFIFPIDGVTRLIEHAEQATERRPKWEQNFDRSLFLPEFKDVSDDDISALNGKHLDRTKIPAGLWMVKDHGVYLMSNGIGDKTDVVYANGFAPNENQVSGSDYCELLPAAELRIPKYIGERVTALVVDITDTDIGIYWQTVKAGK